MAKMRGIKPDIWTDEKFVSVSPLARLLFIGMWNQACDNGHVDASPVQLKMRVLPMDNCDVPGLIDELVSVGLIERMDGFLKVTNLPIHQNIDLRYLLLCDYCPHDGHTAFSESDRRGRAGKPKVPAKGARSAPTVRPEGARDEVKRSEVKVKGSEGEERRARASAIAEDWTPTPDDISWWRNKYPNVDAKTETEKFINHFLANGKPMKQWGRAWRNWISRCNEFAPRSSRRPTTDDRVRGHLTLAQELAAQEAVEEQTRLELTS